MKTFLNKHLFPISGIIIAAVIINCLLESHYTNNGVEATLKQVEEEYGEAIEIGQVMITKQEAEKKIEEAEVTIQANEKVVAEAEAFLMRK